MATTCAGSGHDSYCSAVGCDSRSGGARTDHFPGSSGYSDVDAATYVARDVSSGVVNTRDTGHYPFDNDLSIEGTVLVETSRYMTMSSVNYGHSTGNTDTITTV